MEQIAVNYSGVLSFHRCASVVKARVGSPALHAAARADPGQRDEDERSHEHRTTPPLLTLLVTSWLELKAPPCKYSRVQSTVSFIFTLLIRVNVSALPLFLSRFEVGFSPGCEVMFMKVCAEGRKTASTDWMPPSVFTMPLRDIPPLTPERDPWQPCRPCCRFCSCTIHTTAEVIQVTSVVPYGEI